MVFNSLTFILFFCIVLVLYYLPFSWRTKKCILLIESYIFYAAWNPPFVILLWISTVADWYFAKSMDRTENSFVRKCLLAGTLLVNLGMLGFFKYGGFLLETFTAILHQFGLTVQFAKPDIILPVGISFYTFQTLSYTLDVYMRRNRSWHSFLDYSLYVTFFPQLVAGPIVRASDFLYQLETPKKATLNEFNWGVTLILIGLFQKIVLADTFLAPMVERLYDSSDLAGMRAAWTGTLAFAGQIFCDFSGYSTCAIGCAMCMGFSLMTNFNCPYAAIGFSDFWKRWHISLSTWLRDYLYIPMGGNRKSLARTQTNLMATMLIGGLWHGASWTFVVWGGMHGTFLIIERRLTKIFGKNPFWQTSIIKLLLSAATFAAICFTWVFFRAHTFDRAFAITSAMLGLAHPENGIYFDRLTMFILIGIIGGLLLVHWVLREKSLVVELAKIPWWVRSLGLAFILVAIVLSNGEDRAFIYFQF